jgi:transcriptional regulator with XRE-family HTH domain
MDDVTRIIAKNLKLLRARRNMSLGDMAKSSGVSKSMLGEIERGEVNPTVFLLCKIAGGLKISFSELLSLSKEETEAVSTSSGRFLSEDEGRYRAYVLFPFHSERRFEILYIEIDAGSRVVFSPELEGAQKFLVVFSGKIMVHIDNEKQFVESGGAIRFAADKPHQYNNIGFETCRLCLTVYYSS